MILFLLLSVNVYSFKQEFGVKKDCGLSTVATEVVKEFSSYFKVKAKLNRSVNELYFEEDNKCAVTAFIDYDEIPYTESLLRKVEKFNKSMSKKFRIKIVVDIDNADSDLTAITMLYIESIP
jgi:hypothetical protein